MGCCAVTLCLPAYALDSSQAVKDYSLTEWRTTNGLPYPAIRATAQSADGYLWVATRTGLGRFDGLNFTTYTSANLPILASNDVQTVCAGPADTLWIGTAKGVIWYKNGVWSRPTLDQAIESSAVSAFCCDSEAGMWIGADQNLYRYTADGGCKLRASVVTMAVPITRIEGILQSPHGEIFVVATEQCKIWHRDCPRSRF